MFSSKARVSSGWSSSQDSFAGGNCSFSAKVTGRGKKILKKNLGALFLQILEDHLTATVKRFMVHD